MKQFADGRFRWIPSRAPPIFGGDACGAIACGCLKVPSELKALKCINFSSNDQVKRYERAVPRFGYGEPR